jgi:SAM-dependent methyltransferase
MTYPNRVATLARAYGGTAAPPHLQPSPGSTETGAVAAIEADRYLLGRAEAEEGRLERQAADFAAISEEHFDRAGVKAGERVVELGCGPGGELARLARRVGSMGAVLGIERSPHFAKLARQSAVDQGWLNVEVREGDAYHTGLPRGSFDGGHMRLVLCNVPRPELIARELVSLVRPGGWVTSFEADYSSHHCDPPLAAWTRLLDAFKAYSAEQGIDLNVGRRTHRLFREAGLTDIQVDAVVGVHALGHPRRTILRDFINNVRDNLIDDGFIARDELEHDMRVLDDYLSDPEALVTSHVFYRLWGRVPR